MIELLIIKLVFKARVWDAILYLKIITTYIDLEKYDFENFW